ncbi:hypothetical protein NE237_031149 [Protea cynaroides]|uniref:Stigma-specific Stig1 family protein n=1 Tax=Protea cynaroides TaxID=273540 RepID=A0A9Q0L0X8_9MAGN|nr:hypothetical protein NE237_031149 [Protea cynaroides]
MITMKIFFSITIVMALAAITLTIATNNRKEEEPVPVKSDDHHSSPANRQFIPLKRVSRFLAEQKNGRASDHCHEDNDTCGYDEEGQETTCCNNKCVNLQTDSRYCGACKNKCLYTHTCCNGECVDLSFDKRHCGICSKKCITGEFCLYGLCDYA